MTNRFSSRKKSLGSDGGGHRSMQIAYAHVSVLVRDHDAAAAAVSAERWNSSPPPQQQLPNDSLPLARIE